MDGQMNSDAEVVLEALEQQVGCYRRLAKLAELQHEHVRTSRTEELLAVLGQRQQVLDQVAGLEQTILPAKRKWSDYIGALPDPQRGKAQGLMAESRQLLEQITTSDRNDALVLQQRKIEVGRALRMAAAGRQVSRSYASAAYGSRPGSMDIRK
jgi:flagellar biosynthesis/type III secretory pathway chaperone